MYKVAYYIMAGIIFLISLFLFLQSLWITSRIDFEASERSYFIDGQPLVISILLLLMIVLLFFLYTRKRFSAPIVKGVFLAMLILNPVFVMMAQHIPKADAYVVMEIAAQMLRGGVNAFEPGNYMYICVNQNGFLLFHYVLAKLFGSRNYILVQLLNAVLVDLLYVAVYRYIKKYASEYADLSMLCLCAFFPITLYTTFCYGTIIGLVFSVLAIIAQQCYFKEKKWRYLLLSGILISFAVQLKSNYLIFLIGMLLCFVFEGIKEKNYINVVGIVLTVVFLLLGNYMTDCGLSKITDGTSKGIKGTPYSSYVVMGLQESTRAPGWYNGYVNKVYEESEWDYAAAVRLCGQDLQNEIQRKIEQPAESVDFFAKKIASQWCEPAFQGFWYNREDYQSVIEKSNLYYELASSSGRISRIIYLALDAYQSLIYFGILLYIGSDKKKVIFHNVGLIIFCGGFIFHMFWEGKSSYTFPYFVLLIPYAAAGIVNFFNYLLKFRTEGLQNIHIWSRKLILFVLMICLWFGVKEFRVAEDTEEWEQYVREHRFVPEGIYYLQPAAQASAAFSFGLEFYADYDWTYELRETRNHTGLLMVDEESLVMQEVNLEELDGYYGWRIERLNGGYCFRWYRNSNQVLTYDAVAETLCLSAYEENNMNQIWHLSNP